MIVVPVLANPRQPPSPVFPPPATTPIGEPRVVDISEDEDFTADLVFDGVFVVSVDDFEGVELSGWAMDDFVDCAAATDSSSLSREEKFSAKTIPKASPGSSNISGSSTSKDQHNYQYPVPEVKQRKRHRRKHFENQEPCVMRGVYLKNMKWQAAIKVDKKQIHLGTVGSQEEAARLYDRAAFMCGREPNFELSEAEKQELRKFKWDEFLAMTRSSITSKRLLITSDVAADVDGEPLGEGYCKVYVGKAINPNVRLERPRAFVETVGDALGRYVAWRFCDENSLACHLQKMQVKTLAAELPYPYSNVS
ncbi:hypothetical protein Vadar_022418 [Vaccinium darrowii]|uniref:Uncharacterized protein n=1 Tax=Vaccinium darrowii TaxID=229202 RepID=A0ACB7ZFM2_9ERIC|nr:hypothetical protein Vadar_022418 [Vaccinium darrowii]